MIVDQSEKNSIHKGDIEIYEDQQSGKNIVEGGKAFKRAQPQEHNVESKHAIKGGNINMSRNIAVHAPSPVFDYPL